MSLETETLDSVVLRPDCFSAELSTGTTIMAVEYKDGVVIGADSRTTMGSYIASRVSDKLTKITDRIYCCRSGSAADTQAIADIVRYRLNLFQMENNEEPRVLAAANIFKDLCYNYREQLKAGIICAGWDERDGPSVYSIPLGGALVRDPLAIGGSGGGYIYGFCDAKFRRGMSEDECVDFVREAVSLAMLRDGSSGGVIRIAIIDKNGVRKKLYTGDDVSKMYKSYEL